MPNRENDRSEEGYTELLADILADDEVELDLLLRHARAPESLSEVDRDRVEAYLAASPAHRDRARVMTRLAASGDALDALGVSADEIGPDRAPGVDESASSGAEIIPLDRFRWTSMPLALAASIALTVLGVGTYTRWMSTEGPVSVRVAEDPAQTDPAPLLDTTPRFEGEEPTQLAEEQPLPESQRKPVLVEEGTEESASERVAEVPTPPATLPELQNVPTPEPEPLLEEGEPILLAAMLSAGPFDYVQPDGFDALVRIEGYLRSATTDPLVVTTLAPRHRGLTLEASPTLYWFVSRDTVDRQEIVIIDDRDRMPIYQGTLPASGGAGFQSVDLALLGVELETDVDYRWTVAVVHDPERRDRDTVAAAEIRRVTAPVEITSRRNDANRSERGHVLARQGIWYDALDFLSREIERSPDEMGLAKLRAQLLLSVGLEDAAVYDGNPVSPEG